VYVRRRPKFNKRRSKRKIGSRRRPRYRVSRIAYRTIVFRRFGLPQEIQMTLTAGIPSLSTQAYSFQLSSALSSTEFTALFDQYQIRGVAVRLVPHFNVWNITPEGGNGPRCYYVIDFDDSTASTNEDEIIQHGRCKSFRPERGFRVYFKPRPNNEFYNATASSGYGIARASPWMDCSSPSVPHYGLKILMFHPDPGVAGKLNYHLETIYYLGFKFSR